jgi:hypothetical protein
MTSSATPGWRLSFLVPACSEAAETLIAMPSMLAVGRPGVVVRGK